MQNMLMKYMKCGEYLYVNIKVNEQSKLFDFDNIKHVSRAFFKYFVWK